jgi:hypothetical protein
MMLSFADTTRDGVLLSRRDKSQEGLRPSRYAQVSLREPGAPIESGGESDCGSGH